MTPLRQRMVEDMTIRNLSRMTQKCYVRQVAKFAQYFGKSPEDLGPEQIRAYQVHLVHERKVSASLLIQAVCALRFLYQMTLDKEWPIRFIPYPKRPRRLAVVLSLEEVVRFFEAVPDPKHRMILMTAYSAGLRADEVIHLKVHDIDSQRMLIRVEQGKGQKDRFVPLSAGLLVLLRQYWKMHQPPDWLFPGESKDRPISYGTVQRVCRRANKASGIHKRVTLHLLRHCYATHLLEAGEDRRAIQLALGHQSARTTDHYIHLAPQILFRMTSPFDKLPTQPRL